MWQKPHDIYQWGLLQIFHIIVEDSLQVQCLRHLDRLTPKFGIGGWLLLFFYSHLNFWTCGCLIELMMNRTTVVKFCICSWEKGGWGRKEAWMIWMIVSLNLEIHRLKIFSDKDDRMYLFTFGALKAWPLIRQQS